MEEEKKEIQQRTKSIRKNGVFENPWAGFEERGLFDVIKWKTTSKNLSNVPNQLTLDEKLPIETPNFDKLQNPPKDKIQVMWIGHATVFVQMEGLNILTDPIWSNRCSPSQWFGPKRYRKPPCELEKLPKIDIVLISHNHYDHLDLNTVKKLGNGPTWFVPLQTKAWFNRLGIDKVIEMDWWDQETFQNVVVASTPNQHWCKRGPFDTNKCLWSSWVVKGPNLRFYFAGDTGYCRAFKEIGDEFGPFDLAAIPIGAYEPRWFMKPQHVDPDEAVEIHKDIKSKASLGIHWGTFVLTDEYYLEPPEKLKKALEEQKLSPEEFFVTHHGEVKMIP